MRVRTRLVAGASDSHKRSFSSYNVTTSHSRASLVSAYTDSPITVSSELFDIAFNATRPEAIPMSLFTPGASIKVKLGQTISLAMTKDRSATLQLGHQLDHLLTFDEWQPASFLYAALMADIFKNTAATLPLSKSIRPRPKSARISTLASELLRLLCDGRIAGPFDYDWLRLQVGSFRSNPLSVIEKRREPGQPPKHRVIENMSYPRACDELTEIESCNDLLTANVFPCRWTTLAQLVRQFRALPPSMQCFGFDFADAFYRVPLLPSP
ncbi:BQ5605_C001g00604 [Microbotryum silenes-dioicae]|uniref:BQ5605_C001g00604 protein n=1 Tax=Microbotryum silenes-dioicae TaxID=796604 RepID=A0A2X0MY74_9BASI|nr:BQ5605_C001g00604 [Microbotryum silenes-dioicae]